MRDYQTKANQGGLPDSITAEKLGAGEANSTLTESKTAVQSSGQTLAPADGTAEVTDQLAKALAIYGAGGGEYHIDTGAVNAYVLNPVSPKKSPPAYFDGFTVMFEPGNDNTGAATVNVASLGVVDIVEINGGALTGGEITDTVRMRYDSASGDFKIVGNVSQVKVGTFTRDMTAATGSQVITGVGFKPKGGVFIASVNNTTMMSVGVDDTVTHAGVRTNDPTTTDTWLIGMARTIDMFDNTGPDEQIGIVSSWDSDGFTIGWTKFGAPAVNTATIFYLVWR